MTAFPPKPRTAALTPEQAALLEAARRTRRDATAFAAIVARFGREMPGHLSAFHDIMRDVRVTARRLESGDALVQEQDPPARPHLLAAE